MWKADGYQTRRQVPEKYLNRYLCGKYFDCVVALNNHERNLWFGFFVADKMTLHIPDVDLEPEVNELFSSPETVEKLEQCVMNWQTNITVVLEEQQHKKPQVCGSAMFRVSQTAGLAKL